MDKPAAIVFVPLEQTVINEYGAGPAMVASVFSIFSRYIEYSLQGTTRTLARTRNDTCTRARTHTHTRAERHTLKYKT